MKLRPDQTDERSLAKCGEEAAALLVQHDFASLVDRFGYATAYGRELAKAVEDDFRRETSSPKEMDGTKELSITVRYFKPNNSNLLAVIECIVPLNEGAAVLLELVVTATGEDRNITLEDITNVI
jgi:hypothetical protein